MQKKASVSLCMIVKNEEEFILQCLESVKDIVDEMIVVDTGSTDDTVKIAEACGATIYRYQWNDSFSDARNFSISKATCDWILLLDADEAFEKEDQALFFELISHLDVHGYHFMILNYTGTRSSKQYSMHNAFRLLRNNGLYHFSNAIHEQINRIDGAPVEKGMFIISKVRLHHYGYLDEVVKAKEKKNRNLPLLLRAVEQDPENSFYLFNLANGYLSAEKYELAISTYDKAYRTIDLTLAYAPHLIYRRAMTYGMLKRYQEAVDAVAQGLAVYPDCTDLEFLRGMTYSNWGRYTLAIDSFHKCMQMGEPPQSLKFFEGSSSTRPLQWLGNIYKRFHDYKKAFECYEKALLDDKMLYQNLYHIGECLNKLYLDKKKVTEIIKKFFADPSYVPNLIVLTDIQIRQKLYQEAAHSIAEMDRQDSYQTDLRFLKAKHFFYTCKYQNSYDLFESILTSTEEINILQNILGESAEYLFALHLILADDPAEKYMKYIEVYCGEGTQKLCKQILSILNGNSECVFSTNEDWKEVENSLFGVLDKILNVREFDLFEKLICVLNYIDTKNVLVFLAAIYHHNGYDDMAVKQVIRSIKELDYIDETGVEILSFAYPK
ncbi:MAG: glycosyltransferase [Lawsonibacter sp.]|nr:glycosyltransferase [Lawsonibacter sp.]